MGTVAQNGNGGIFVDTTNGDGGRVFIRNYPYTVPDGRKVTIFALHVGAMQYRTVKGSDATVAEYDYGTPYNPFALPVSNSTNSEALKTNALIAKPK